MAARFQKHLLLLNREIFVEVLHTLPLNSEMLLIKDRHDLIADCALGSIQNLLIQDIEVIDHEGVVIIC